MNIRKKRKKKTFQKRKKFSEIGFTTLVFYVILLSYVRTHAIFLLEVKTVKCPICGYTESRVVDSRPTEGNSSIRRRRECLSCQKRFTTYEVLESLPLIVIKKDGTQEIFDKSKLLAGIIKSCYKCPVTTRQMEQIAAEIESELQNSLSREISSKHIGVLVMNKLKDLNDVAYVRFASIYREFKDLETFMQELEKLQNEKKQNKIDDSSL
jgi:transcriptional repressor NrdR